MRAELSGETIHRLGSILVTSACVGVVLAYVVCACRLIAYPWDWSPDEGMYLDWGRRALKSPSTLYARSWSPVPALYGPGLPVLLAPLAALGMPMLKAGRLLALVWTGAGVAAVYLLTRAAGRTLALAAAALSIAALDVTFFTMLVRPDGPMIAFWLLAAVALIPSRLEPGADALTAARVAAGTALVLLAVLTKLTAVLYAAPLVLGWLAVDRRSALRLTLALALTGAALVLALQWATGGAYLWANGYWMLHPSQPGLRRMILGYSAARLWPYAAVALTAVAFAGRHRQHLRDGAVLLVAGVLLVIPLLSKYGASWNYLLPLAPALSVLAARSSALAAGTHRGRRLLAASAIAIVAAVLAGTRVFPLPTAADERTAAALYGFVGEHTRRSGGPILALRPELAYFLVGQPSEVDGASFAAIAGHDAPGTDRVLRRLRDGTYTLLVRLHELPPTGGFEEAVRARYVHAGGCNVTFYFGTAPVHLFTRRDLPLFMAPPPGTRCGGPSGS